MRLFKLQTQDKIIKSYEEKCQFLSSTMKKWEKMEVEGGRGCLLLVLLVKNLKLTENLDPFLKEKITKRFNQITIFSS